MVKPKTAFFSPAVNRLTQKFKTAQAKCAVGSTASNVKHLSHDTPMQGSQTHCAYASDSRSTMPWTGLHTCK